MRKKWKRLIKQIFLLLVFILQILFTGGFSIGKARIESSTFDVATDVNHQNRADFPEILSLLEEKVGNREVTQKLKDKAVTLSKKQTRMIASLAELISSGDRAVGAEVAFLVVTILIIVS
jgi:hypothetical protein